MSNTGAEEGQDKVLIIQMLLEHEKRLKQIDGELRSVREYLTDIDALREQLSEWLTLTERGVVTEERRAAEARTGSGNVASIRRLLKTLTEMERQRSRDFNDNR